MKKKIKERVTTRWLRKIGVPAVVIPGLILAGILGWNGWKKLGPDFYNNKQIFPESGVVREIVDGDTFEIQNGIRVRLVGINALADDQKSKNKLVELVQNKTVWLEYDRYQDDKYGRILAWIWLDCESKPIFLPADYMHKSNNESYLGITNNPVGCREGKLVQEELVKSGLVKVEVFKDRGELKYEKRIGF